MKDDINLTPSNILLYDGKSDSMPWKKKKKKILQWASDSKDCFHYFLCNN